MARREAFKLRHNAFNKLSTPRTYSDINMSFGRVDHGRSHTQSGDVSSNGELTRALRVGRLLQDSSPSADRTPRFGAIEYEGNDSRPVALVELDEDDKIITPSSMVDERRYAFLKGRESLVKLKIVLMRRKALWDCVNNQCRVNLDAFLALYLIEMHARNSLHRAGCYALRDSEIPNTPLAGMLTRKDDGEYVGKYAYDVVRESDVKSDLYDMNPKSQRRLLLLSQLFQEVARQNDLLYEGDEFDGRFRFDVQTRFVLDRTVEDPHTYYPNESSHVDSVALNINTFLNASDADVREWEQLNAHNEPVGEAGIVVLLYSYCSKHWTGTELCFPCKDDYMLFKPQTDDIVVMRSDVTHGVCNSKKLGGYDKSRDGQQHNRILTRITMPFKEVSNHNVDESTQP